MLDSTYDSSHLVFILARRDSIHIRDALLKIEYAVAYLVSFLKSIPKTGFIYRLNQRSRICASLNFRTLLINLCAIVCLLAWSPSSSIHLSTLGLLPSIATALNGSIGCCIGL